MEGRRIMKSLYRIKLIVFGLLLAFLLPVFVQAAGSNNLTIIKLLNEGNHFINEKPEGSTPVSGAIYKIWRIGAGEENTSQVSYDQILRNLGNMSLDSLDREFSQPENKLSLPTDVEGRTSFENLTDGRYYIREVIETENGLITSQYSIPFLVDLPLIINDETIRNVTVYPKSTTPTTPPPPPPEEPPTGGEKFIKVDSQGRNLAGARFKVVDRVQDEQGNYIKDAGGNFVYRSVYLDGEEILLVSDGNGRFEVNGLSYGVYWLVETAAPLGYRLLTQPLEFTITRNSYDDSVVIQIVNQEEPPGTPPETPPDTPPSVPPDVPTKPPESPPDTPIIVTPPDVPISPPKGPIPPITIPKTGDIEIFLFIAAGLAMVILGAWITKDTQIN